MFTGIIQDIGNVEKILKIGDDLRFTINTDNMDLSDIDIGDSISVNGVCLTVIDKERYSFKADISCETLKRTTLSVLKTDSKINLEKAIRLSDRINGHIVSGHVDGVGIIIDKKCDGRSFNFNIEIPNDLGVFIVEKGSVTVDGVSLTVNFVDDVYFSVNIIPHTIEETIFDNYELGSKVNIEVDMIARYLKRLLKSE